MTVKKGGRPRLDDGEPADSAQVCLTLPARVYDATYQRAQRERTTVPEIIRRDMRQAAKDRRKTSE